MAMVEVAQIISTWYKKRGYEGKGMPHTQEALNDLLEYIQHGYYEDPDNGYFVEGEWIDHTQYDIPDDWPLDEFGDTEYIDPSEIGGSAGHYADENMIPRHYDEDGNEIYGGEE